MDSDKKQHDKSIKVHGRFTAVEKRGKTLEESSSGLADSPLIAYMRTKAVSPVFSQKIDFPRALNFAAG